MRAYRASLVLFLVGLAARLGVVLWAGSRFPPAADGVFYDTFARRLAEGAGYTWLWDDGTVTPAAHYPVGYPALLAVFYLVFGAKPVVAGIANAIIGAGAVFATHRLALASGDRRAMMAAIVVAIHPALVAYTPAIMTEGIATSLVVIAAALGQKGSKRRLAAAGLVLGAATLVRPQSLVFAPLLGLCAMPTTRTRMLGACVATAFALLVCAPWTYRNCEKMHRCALVSVNAGWNLLIGTQTESGVWQEIEVPPECRTVWDEAEKDACFERAAKGAIAAHPLAWMRRAPSKLRATFDYSGAGPMYLHASNPKELSERASLVWGVLATLASRALLMGAFIAWVRRARGDLSRIACFAGMLLALTDQSWIAYLLLALVVLRALTKAGKVHDAAAASLAPFRRSLAPVSQAFSALAILATAIVHAIFFGASRYGLAVIPFVALLAFSSEPSASSGAK